MPRRWTAVLLLSVSLGLTACGVTDGAAYKVGGSREQTLSLIREQDWLWSDFDLSIVVARQPDCMRRHHVKPISRGATLKVELYRSLEGGFILRQGKRWYVAETGQCQLQQFDAPPTDPGDVLGAFVVEDGNLQFKPVDADRSKAGKSVNGTVNGN